MVSYAVETHEGRVRQNNEDCVLANERLGLFAVADGVGGNRCGEQASRLTCDVVEARLTEQHSLQESILEAHRALRVYADRHAECQGMATTLVACLLEESVFQISWVGDSRAYLWNRFFLRQLTKDHSYVEHLIADEQITRQEALTHPYRHILMHAVGSGEDELLRIDTVSGSLHEGDILLLCSDGLYGDVPENSITTVLESELSLKDKAHCLLDTALNNGGRDNISLILVQFGA